MNLRKLKAVLSCIALSWIVVSSSIANPWNGKVVLQGFWWDYWNSNYQNNWSTYLADLSPRLRDMGIDGVWIPPTPKNKNATGSVGYSTFDHYDLGDKYQGGSVSTRFGNKDQYLRMVGVMHANGMDVIQDMVWNHIDGAGSMDGSGGQDPNAWSNKWKNFRYVSYATPGSAETSANYLARSGRFSKNWPNFHPNSAYNTEGDDWSAGYWGPDICYYSGAYGQSSNATYNPTQGPNYMRDGVRAWSIWLKKQTGVDGFRLDAVKHFPQWATKDFLWNLAYNAGWASGGSQMFVVGEYVGSKTELDGWVDAVNNSDGFSDVVGTFDFSLRQAIKDMVSGNGGYDLGSIPGAQQNRRNRTVPFVNNHDTFRPQLDSLGRYIGWNSGNELGGGHIDPYDGRIQAAYAIAMAVDGSPQIFFEDLFDVSNGKRWSHMPTNTADLPARDWLVNLIWCHQKLNFKDGAYNVRWQAQDLLIIERSAKAIIGVNDSWTNWQSATVQTNFGPNVQLKDYSGANANNIWTDGSGRATIWVPPCNGSNVRRGYCVWGPVGIGGGFSPAIRTTTQEWEMADDLGDSHASSLKQGGAMPASSTATRTAGRIYSDANKAITVNLYPADATKNLTIQLCNAAGTTVLQTVSGTGNLTLNYTPTTAGYYTLKAKNTSTSNPTQKVWIKATYTGPQNLNSGGVLLAESAVEVPGDAAVQATPTFSINNFPNPFSPMTTISFTLPERAPVKVSVYNVAGQLVKVLADETMEAGPQMLDFDGSGYPSGAYFVRLATPGMTKVHRMTLLK